MPSYSQRKGIVPLQKLIQRESIDDDLRNGLWSALDIVLWRHWSEESYGYKSPATNVVENLFGSIWLFFFKKPSDTQPLFDGMGKASGVNVLRDYFYRAKWFELYDFLEFILENIKEEYRESLRSLLNHFLERENSGCRIVGIQVVDITDPIEIESLESSMGVGISSIREHLTASLGFLYDRSNPDYRNSVKESISAVESGCQIVSGHPKATLSSCLKTLKKNSVMHGAFEDALSKLYAYTCDEGGIRHALTNEASSPTFSEAKFVLVTASAFVNYLLGRASELNIDIGSSN